MKFLALLLGILFLLAVPSASQAVGLEMGVGGWSQAPSGTVAYKANDDIDIVDQAELEKETNYFARAKLDTPLMLPNIYLTYSPMQFEGKGKMSKTFEFGNVTYDANATFETSLKLNHADMTLYYGLPFLDTATLGVLNAEIGLNVRYVDFGVEVKGTETGTGVSRTESADATLYIPMVYAGVQLKPAEAIALEVEYRGLSFNSNKYTDFIGRVKVKPFGPVFIAAGYRQETVVIDESDLELDMSFEGPFLEAGFQF